MAVFWISKLSSSWRNKSSVRNFKAHQEGVAPLKKNREKKRLLLQVGALSLAPECFLSQSVRSDQKMLQLKSGFRLKWCQLVCVHLQG